TVHRFPPSCGQTKLESGIGAGPETGSGRGGTPGVLAVVLFGQPGHRDQVVALFELDEANPLRVPADGRDVCRVQTDDHTFFGDEHHTLVTDDELGPHHRPVAAAGLDVDDALAAPALQAVLADG